MDTYGHLLSEAHEEATRALDRLVGGQQDVVQAAAPEFDGQYR